jgi:hypothetical protein
MIKQQAAQASIWFVATVQVTANRRPQSLSEDGRQPVSLVRVGYDKQDVILNNSVLDICTVPAPPVQLVSKS